MGITLPRWPKQTPSLPSQKTQCLPTTKTLTRTRLRLKKRRKNTTVTQAILVVTPTRAAAPAPRERRRSGGRKRRRKRLRKPSGGARVRHQRGLLGRRKRRLSYRGSPRNQ